MTGKVRTSLAAQDLEQIVDAKKAYLQAHPTKFEETTTPDATCNMQQVPRVQAPPSISTTHIDDKRRITRSMHPQPPVPRVPTNELTSKPTITPIIKPTNEPTSKPTRAPDIKPTNLPTDLSKPDSVRKQQAA
jgi:hypothetical protein